MELDIPEPDMSKDANKDAEV
jgi:hypothetical protein